MKKINILLCLLITINMWSQHESDNWYFGEYAGLNFSNGDPIALTDGKMNTFEGCATLSDPNGNLLFYTDGIRVWDKNHQVMPNGTGLKGDSSTTQSSIIVPKPNSSTIYYIFTCAKQAENDGLRYSVVDMSLNSGQGDITSEKNILLTTPVCEKLTAVKNKNNNDYWVITHGYGNNQFLAYQITNSGIANVPITSNVGITVDTEDRRTVGYMKVSPQGKRIISCNNYYSGVEMYDFDAATGLITNPRKVNNLYFNYGVEFSPNENIAYVSGGVGESIQLLQYDLTAPDIPSSEVVLEDRVMNGNFLTYFEAMQLAKNGKIYGVTLGSSYVFAINKPNILGVGCEVVLDAVSLGTGKCQYGLPQFIQSFFKVNAKIEVKNTCFNSNTSFLISADQPIVNVLWDFGDGTTSTDISPNHTYLKSGIYNISATINSQTIISESITISEIPKAFEPEDIFVCDDDNDGFYIFNLTAQNSAILNGQDPILYSVTYFSNGKPIDHPEAYTNFAAYQQEVISVTLHNRTNENCSASTSFVIDVFDTPKPKLSSSIPELSSCDNLSVGNDTDGRIVFDLTSRASDILNTQSAMQFVLSYYKDALMTQEIVAPQSYTNTSTTETIFVKITNRDNPNCAAQTAFTVKVYALPAITGNIILKQCDDDVDGYTNFNLEQSINKIATNSTDLTITFHKNLIDAQNNNDVITDPTAYRNQIVSSDKVYARVTNQNNCYKIAELNLIVSTTQIPAAYSKIFTQCDDSVSGSNKDGIATFDFSDVTTDLKTNVFPSGQLLDITYYQNLEDALSEKNAIADISNYRNSGSPFVQKIFIRVDSRLNNDCLGLGGYITLTVERTPVVQDLTIAHCDDNHDGLYAFDTTNLQRDILNDLKDVTITYTDQNNNVLTTPLPNPFTSPSQIVKVFVKNNTTLACAYESTVTFVVDNLPEAYPVSPVQVTVCDDESDPELQDGKYAFDTSTIESVLLGSQKGMLVNYYDTSNNRLPSPLPDPFLTHSQVITAEVVNQDNPSCSAHTTISFIVLPVPKINLKGEELVCSNLPTFSKEIDAGLLDVSEMNNYNYKWFFNGNIIADALNYNLLINKEGVFTVEVIDKKTNCKRSRTINVAASDIAATVAAVVDQSNTIFVSVTGKGNYVYALDDENGHYQTENTFVNVNAGIHTVYIKDLNGCGTVKKEVTVFGIPKFFTPNQDGYNDYWNLEGIDPGSYPNTSIQIFDRYGKLLKQLDPSTEGWDGTYRGKEMPADDYWYLIKLDDDRIFKGHFSLKR